MALKAQNKLSPEWWSPTEAEDAPRYKLRPLNGMEYLDVAPGMSIDEQGYIRYDGNAMKALVRYGLLDWEGIEDPDTGEPLEFGRDAVNRLPPLQLRQIAQEVANRTQLTEGEAKKLRMAVEVGRNAKDFDCQTCLVKHCDETGELPGSNGIADFDVWDIDGVGYRTCPLMQITTLSRQFISLHNHYSKQLLWQAGGLMDQPKAYLQAMEIIESKPYD